MTTSTETRSAAVSIASASHRRPAPAALPIPATPFFGRERDVAEIRGHLADAPRRLVTLTGPGGVGKTRLALRVAAGLTDHFADGVVFVPLATVADPGLVLHAVAMALRVAPDRDAPADRAWLAGLVGALYDRQALIVLDNVEHVPAAAPAIAELLAGCPALRVLATSRVALHLTDEQEYPVAPLPLPPSILAVEEGAEAPAVALFVERARAVRPSFALTATNVAAVTEICRRLEGLPLALELAAARIAHLSPAALLDRLEHRLPLLTGGPGDAPHRHRTMRDAIAWSVDLLDPADRSLFAHLAVFAGSFGLAAAEAVSRGVEKSRSREDERPLLDSSTPRLLDLVSSLLDKNLLRRVDGGEGEPRYAMLETIREYAAELLAGSGEADGAAARLADWLAELNDQAAVGIRGQEQAIWLARLEAEQANFGAMTTWALEREDAETALRLTTKAMWFYWETRGLVRETTRQLTRAIAIAEREPGRVDPTWLARGYIAHGMRLMITGDFDQAQHRLEVAVRAFREAGDRVGLAHAISNLAVVLSSRGDYSGARRLMEEAIAIRRELGDPRALVTPLINLGATTISEGDLTAAKSILEEAAPHVERFGEQRDRAALLLFRGELAALAGRTDEARALLTSARSQLREIPDVRGVAMSSLLLALALRASGDVIATAETLDETFRVARDVDDRSITALALAELAGTLLDVDQPTEAARMLGAAAAMRAAMGIAIRPVDAPRWNELTRRARTTLGAEAFAAAEQTGRLLPPHEAMAEGIALAASVAQMESPPPISADEPGRSLTIGGFEVQLTSREQAVLRLLVEGQSDREIADHLSISPRTVSSHVGRILAKLDVRTRTAATAIAIRDRLV